MTATTDLQPTPVSQRYTVRLHYRHGGVPHVHVLAPQLRLHPDATALPHTYPGDRLCLHLPGQWQPTMLIAHTTIPWTSEWLLYYEIWLATGHWGGGGHGEPPHPAPESISQHLTDDNRAHVTSPQFVMARAQPSTPRGNTKEQRTRPTA